MKKSAVEWLYERLERMIPRTALYNIDKVTYLEQAKQIEKQQIEDAFYTEQIDEFGDEVTFEEYYNETFNK